MKLEGWEVKAIAQKSCSIVGAHCQYWQEQDGVFLLGATIGNSSEHMLRPRKLLLHKKEINKLIGKTKEKGLTVIPLRVYNKNGKFKLAIGIARGKKEYDKRESEKKRDIELETRKIVKSQKLE